MKGRSPRANRRTQRRSDLLGLTLVELMVALTISLLIVLVIASLYLGNRQTFRVSDGQSRVHDSARVAFSFISRALRDAGFRGCAGAVKAPVNALASASAPAFDFARSVQGYDSEIDGTAWNVALPAAIAGAATGSDVLLVRTLAGSMATVVAHPGVAGAPGSGNLTLTPDSGFAANDIVLASDCQGSAFFQLSAVISSASSDVLEHAAGPVLPGPGNATAELGKEFAGGDLVKVATYAFFVGNNAAGVRSLYRQELSSVGAAPIELVDGVESLQLTYGIDATDDRSADRYDRADVVESAANWANVVSVRVELLAGSSQDGVATAPMSYSMDGVTTPYTSDDRRLRQVYTTTVALRNRVR